MDFLLRFAGEEVSKDPRFYRMLKRRLFFGMGGSG